MAPTAPSTATAAPPPKPARTEVILATTTSTQDSGLLDLLVPAFQKATGYQVKVVAVGSGAAMQMGERGDADVLLVHSPAAEEKFVADGFGIERTLVMHNDFVMIGPAGDPAGLKGVKTVAEAMKKLADKKATFVSRGDNSGTDFLEKNLWKSAGLTTPKGQSWYLETGQGMGATLTVAREKQAYTVTDRATFLAFTGKSDLPILLEGDPALLNVYHVIVPNPAKLPKTNTEGGRAFKAFLISADVQKLIGEFGKEKYGRPLFFADAGKPEPTAR
ncbi:MAG: extracellular solute-binding protein [Chloroflexi bacterium]|nr:extracellular solute-binding protein [Chloroflexota bacterium]